MTRILLLEDDHLQAQLIEEAIKRDLPSVEVNIISTELEFREKITEFAAHPPDVIVLDIMVRWARPSRQMSLKPPGGYFRAGVRCLALLSEHRVTTPVIVFTVSDLSEAKTDIELWRKVEIISKENHIQGLIKAIRKHILQTPA